MEVLLNRFKRPRNTAKPPAQTYKSRKYILYF